MNCKPIPEHGPAIEGCVIPVVTKIEPLIRSTDPSLPDGVKSESEKLQEELEPLPEHEHGGEY